MNPDELLSAIQNSNVEVIKRLSNENLGNDESVLHYAVSIGNAEVVKALLDVGAKKWLNSFDDMALTPLMWAAKNNNLGLVRLLISAGANINAHDESRAGNTALREAIETCDLKIVEELIAAGADPNIPGWMQLTALDKAMERLKLSDTAVNKKIVEILNK